MSLTVPAAAAGIDGVLGIVELLAQQLDLTGQPGRAR
jgi:hypothetical protein